MSQALPKQDIHYNQVLQYEAQQDLPGFYTIGLHSYWNHNRKKPQPGFIVTDEGVLYPAMEPDPSGVMGGSAGYAATVCLAAMWEFRRQGQHLVSIGPGMEKAFADTELDNVPLSHLKSPYPAFFLNLTDSDMRIWGGEVGKTVKGRSLSGETIEHVPGTGWHKLRGAYVIFQDDNILIYYVSDPNEHSESVLDSANGWLNMPLYRGAESVVSLIEKLKEGESPFENRDSTRAYLEENPDLVEAVNKRLGYDNTNLSSWIDEVLADEDGQNSDFHVEPNIVEQQAVAVKHLFHVVINAMLYMNSPRSEQKVVDRTAIGDNRRREAMKQFELAAGAKSARAKRRLVKKANRHLSKAWGNYRTTFIGLSIEERIREVQRRQGGGGAAPGGHLRKGHWHIYKVGPRKDVFGDWIPPHLQDEVLHWVAPTWCGDLDNPAPPRNIAFREPELT